MATVRHNKRDDLKNKNRDEKEMNDEYIFRCKTTDAYIFKIMTELLHNIIKIACFEISPTQISLRMMDSNRRTLVDLVLEASNFNIYYLSGNIENGILNIGINLNHLYRMLKSIKKRDQLVLFILEDRPQDLGIEIMPKDFSRKTISYVKIQNITNLAIALPEEYDHSILISASEFSKMCKDMFNMSNTITVTAKQYSVEFLCNVGSVYSREVILGDTEYRKNNEGGSMNGILFKEDYDTEQMSRILKIAGLSGTMNIKCKKDMPLLMTTRVGIIGKICIYVKSKNQIEEENLQIDL